MRTRFGMRDYLARWWSDARHKFEEAGPTSTLFENRANRGMYLTGPNNGGQFEIMARPAPSGFEQQFTVLTS
jgi:hypothetical protein